MRITPCPPTAAALLAGALTLAACAPGARDDTLSVLLITLDTTRADALGCYGGDPQATPVLDALAGEGLLYERAYTVAPLTQPAHASMMTGLYPVRHAVRDNGIWALPEAAETLAETARDAGVQTAAFVAAVVLSASFGFGQGFDVYDAPLAPAGARSSHYTSRPARETVDAARSWLRQRDRGRNFFLWVHLFDPHAPYEPPPEFGARFPRDTYVGEVASMDHQIGRLLEELESVGAADRTLVVVVADHGEGLDEHREETHGPFCYDTTMRVPLLIRYPDGHRAGQRTRELVSVVDLHPTLLTAMGLESDAGNAYVDGSDLFQRPAPVERPVHFESYYGHFAFGWSPLSGVVSGDEKYLHSSEPELYDLGSDPGETTNLIEARADRAAQYRRVIEEIAARPALEHGEASLDESLQSDIRSLGYAAAADAQGRVLHPLAVDGLPAPARMADEVARTSDAQLAMNAGEYARAEQLLLQLVAANPRNLRCVNLLGLALAYQGRRTEAIPHFRRVVAEGPPRADPRVSLGLCLLSAGQVDEARELYLQALAIDPDHRQALGNLAGLLQAAGRTEEARSYAERLKELEQR